MAKCDNQMLVDQLPTYYLFKQSFCKHQTYKHDCWFPCEIYLALKRIVHSKNYKRLSVCLFFVAFDFYQSLSLLAIPSYCNVCMCVYVKCVETIIIDIVLHYKTC